MPVVIMFVVYYTKSNRVSYLKLSATEVAIEEYRYTAGHFNVPINTVAASVITTLRLRHFLV